MIFVVCRSGFRTTNSGSTWHLCWNSVLARACFVALWVEGLLGGSWDLVTRVISKVTVLITTYNPNYSITLLTKSHDPVSSNPYKSLEGNL